MAVWLNGNAERVTPGPVNRTAGILAYSVKGDGRYEPTNATIRPACVVY